MTEESTAFLPMWMLLSAAFGFIAGEAFGDSTRHRKCLEQINDDLRDRLDEARVGGEPIHRPQAAAWHPQRHPQASDRCDKRPNQTRSLNPTKHTAGKSISGRVKTYSYSHTSRLSSQ